MMPLHGASMLSFFRKKAAPRTLKEKVAAFWEWYAANAARFYATIEAKRCGDLQPEVSEAVDRWLGGMAWVFGPGANEQGHSFTLSGEAVLPRQFVAEYWLSKAPSLEGWTFYASRQPSREVKGFELVLEENHKFSPAELWIHAVPCTDTEKLDITACHPLFSKISEHSSFTGLFLLLDEVLGEHGTQNWIGEIRLSDDRLKDSVPVWELREVTDQVALDHGWKKHKPTETYSLYSRKEPGSGFPRADIFTGCTRYFDLSADFVKERGKMKHPFPEAGVDFVFVSFASSILPKGNEVTYRGEIEDAMVAELERHSSGAGLGGATGRVRTYIDLMIYDGEASMQLLKNTLKKLAIPGGCEIRYFTQDKGKEAHRV
jgi:hypothetical protein